MMQVMQATSFYTYIITSKPKLNTLAISPGFADKTN